MKRKAEVVVLDNSSDEGEGISSDGEYDADSDYEEE